MTLRNELSEMLTDREIYKEMMKTRIDNRKKYLIDNNLQNASFVDHVKTDDNRDGTIKMNFTKINSFFPGKKPEVMLTMTVADENNNEQTITRKI